VKGASALFPNWDRGTHQKIACLMRIVARKTLCDFCKNHPDAEGQIKAWFVETTRATWHGMADIKKQYATASLADSERVVFHVGGNKYRLVVRVWCAGKVVWIKFSGTDGTTRST